MKMRLVFNRKASVAVIVAGMFFAVAAPAENSGMFWREAGAEPYAAFNAPPSFAPISEKVNPAVVTIFSTKTLRSPFGLGSNQFFFGPGPQKEEGLGSGFILTSDGYILTNYHVISGADDIKVGYGDRSKIKYTAKRVGYDERTDVALLKIQAENLPTVVLGDSEKIKVGDWVVAIGSPFSFPHTLTAGIISAKGRRLGGAYDDFIQTDASINPGNSGGPLVNMRGEVVGMNTLIISPGFAGNVGIGFAIPVNLIKSELAQLKEKGSVSWPYLGVYYQDVTPELAESFGLKEARGALISKVVKGAPADKAGVKAGDVILSVNGKPIGDSDELPMIVSQYAPGQTVTLTVFRKGKTEDKPLVLGTLPSQQIAAEPPAIKSANILGLVVTDLIPEAARELGYQGEQGVLVVSVSPKGPIIGQIAPDDLITEMNGRAITNAKEFNDAVAKLKPGQLVRLRYRRGPESIYFAFKLPGK